MMPICYAMWSSFCCFTGLCTNNRYSTVMRAGKGSRTQLSSAPTTLSVFERAIAAEDLWPRGHRQYPSLCMGLQHGLPHRSKSKKAIS